MEAWRALCEAHAAHAAALAAAFTVAHAAAHAAGRAAAPSANHNGKLAALDDWLAALRC